MPFERRTIPLTAVEQRETRITDMMQSQMQSAPRVRAVDTMPQAIGPLGLVSTSGAAIAGSCAAAAPREQAYSAQSASMNVLTGAMPSYPSMNAFLQAR